MSVALAQFGTALKLIDPCTGTQQTLTLPDGVTIDSTKRPSVASLDLGAVIVYSPSRNLMLLQDGTLILLAPAKPSTNLVAATGAAGNLTGAYQWAYTFIRKDGSGNVITESAMSPLSTAVSFTAQQASLSSIDVSTDTDTVTGRRVYRTLSGGAILYKSFDIDNNTDTTATDNNADASLGILPTNSHRTYEVPGTNAADSSKLQIIVSWKNRIWGVTNGAREKDNVLFSEDGLAYNFGSGNTLVASPKGVEATGVVGFIPRRDQLGVGKRGGLWQITGDSELSFSIIQIGFSKGGIIAPRTIQIINDKAYYLGFDGVNRWDDEAIVSLTDTKVKPWFNTDRYFERDEFVNAFAKFNHLRNQYELHLVEVGQSVGQVWVAWNTDTQAWYGIHRTGIANLTCAATVDCGDGTPQVLVGSASGQVYSLDPDTYHDATVTAIALNVVTPKYVGGEPDLEKLFGELSVVAKTETKGFLTVEATLGQLNEETPQSSAMLVDLTLGRHRLRRLGTGIYAQLEFTEESVDQPVTIFGYELPVSVLGRR